MRCGAAGGGPGHCQPRAGDPPGGDCGARYTGRCFHRRKASRPVRRQRCPGTEGDRREPGSPARCGRRRGPSGVGSRRRLAGELIRAVVVRSVTSDGARPPDRCREQDGGGPPGGDRGAGQAGQRRRRLAGPGTLGQGAGPRACCNRPWWRSTAAVAIQRPWSPWWRKRAGPRKAALVTVLGWLGGEKPLAAVRGVLEGRRRRTPLGRHPGHRRWPDATPLDDLLAIASTEDNVKAKVLADVAGLPGRHPWPNRSRRGRQPSPGRGLGLASRPDEVKTLLAALAGRAQPGWA